MKTYHVAHGTIVPIPSGFCLNLITMLVVLLQSKTGGSGKLCFLPKARYLGSGGTGARSQVGVEG